MSETAGEPGMKLLLPSLHIQKSEPCLTLLQTSHRKGVCSFVKAASKHFKYWHGSIAQDLESMSALQPKSASVRLYRGNYFRAGVTGGIVNVHLPGLGCVPFTRHHLISDES